MNVIEIYTDGACSGNPGPAAIGVHIIYNNGKIEEISKSIGHGTNNIAELIAIQTGLEAVKKYNPDKVIIYTDSQYCQGVLSKNWKINSNKSIILEIKKIMSHFKEIDIIHIRGHSGHPQNERANELATKAIKYN